VDDVQDRSDSRQKSIEAPSADVFAAIGDAARIARWWGPRGFRNTIHEFDFRPGGRWRLTMHGADGQAYPNESRFVRIVPDRLVEIEHLSGHHFLLCIELIEHGAGTVVAWRQTFDTVEHYERLAAFVADANEQNLERLAEEVRGSRHTVRTEPSAVPAGRDAARGTPDAAQAQPGKKGSGQ
jgi:uncharacterized protein YndB with AHSA1/START domain